MIKLVWNIGMETVVYSYEVMVRWCKQCRVVTSQDDLDLVVDVPEVEVRPELNLSEILVWEVSLYSYEAMIWYVISVEWWQEGVMDGHMHAEALVLGPPIASDGRTKMFYLWSNILPPPPYIEMKWLLYKRSIRPVFEWDKMHSQWTLGPVVLSSLSF